MTVYVLWHMRPLGTGETALLGETDDKLIGIYSSVERAIEAKSRMSVLEGFRDHPEAFQIDEVVVDETDWQTGFVSLAGDE